MPEAIGVVPLEGRGSLPFLHLHREPLFVHAVRALLEVDALRRRVVVTVGDDQRAAAEAELKDTRLPVPVRTFGDWWPSAVTGGPLTVALHDPLCPLVPPSFLSACIEAVAGQSPDRPDTDRRAVVAFRPVTDTLKTVVDDRVVGTVDRDRLMIVASPVVFVHDPGAGPPPSADFGGLASWLRTAGQVELRRAPSLGRRVDDASAVDLLECMDELARVRET